MAGTCPCLWLHLAPGTWGPPKMSRCVQPTGVCLPGHALTRGLGPSIRVGGRQQAGAPPLPLVPRLLKCVLVRVALQGSGRTSDPGESQGTSESAVSFQGATILCVTPKHLQSMWALSSGSSELQSP